MSTVWVKICGITNLADALVLAQAGADALGFNFVSTSPRAMSRDAVSQILPALPPTVLTVGVVANENPDFLRGLLRVCPVKAFQFHGEESPEEVLALKGKTQLIKAIRVKDAKSLREIPRYQGVDAVLLDTYEAGKRGGTGIPFDWKLAVEAKAYGIPVIVAGGLNPSNVASVIQQVQPYGVDVASGVELVSGRKDHVLAREFILRAKQPSSQWVSG